MTSLNAGICDIAGLYSRLKDVYRYDALSSDGWFVDYQNLYTHLGVMSVRQVFATAARMMAKSGYTAEAIDILDRGMAASRQLPLESIPLGFTANDYMVIDIIAQYYKYGEKEKADNLAMELADGLLSAASFYDDFYSYGQNDFETTMQYLYFLQDEVKKGGNEELSALIDTGLKNILGRELPSD